MPRKSIFFDILRISIHQVIMQRRRYLGVILAVALGTAGFIVIITMGTDVKKTLNRDLDLLGGATLIQAFLDTGHKYSKIQQFQPETIDALRALPGIEAVSAIVSRPGVYYSISKAPRCFLSCWSRRFLLGCQQFHARQRVFLQCRRRFPEGPGLRFGDGPGA